MAQVKVRCPGCGGGVSVKKRFCAACGKPNVYHLPKAARKSAVAGLAKSQGNAAVYDLGQARLWQEAVAENNPDLREQVIQKIFRRGGIA